VRLRLNNKEKQEEKAMQIDRNNMKKKEEREQEGLRIESKRSEQKNRLICNYSFV